MFSLRGALRDRFCIVLLSATAILVPLAWLVFVPSKWGWLLAGRRPMFAEWRPGDRGWSDRMNLVRDKDGVFLLFDRQLNLGAIISPKSKLMWLSVQKGFHVTIIRAPDGSIWRLPRSRDTLIVCWGRGECTTLGIPPHFVEQAASRIPYPEGVFEGSVAELILQLYTGSDREMLESLVKR